MVTPLKREFVRSWMLVFKLCLCFAAFGFISKERAETRKNFLPEFPFRFKIKHKTSKQKLSCLDVSVIWFS